MAYSKVKLKSNGDKASPRFKPFLIGNMSDKFLPFLTSLIFIHDSKMDKRENFRKIMINEAVLGKLK
jgi:hypothetical protein